MAHYYYSTAACCGFNGKRIKSFVFCAIIVGDVITVGSNTAIHVELQTIVDRYTTVYCAVDNCCVILFDLKESRLDDNNWILKKGRREEIKVHVDKYRGIWATVHCSIKLSSQPVGIKPLAQHLAGCKNGCKYIESPSLTAKSASNLNHNLTTL